MIDKLTPQDYQLLVTVLRQKYIDETCRLAKENASDREWDTLNDLDRLMIKCQFLEIQERDNAL